MPFANGGQEHDHDGRSTAPAQIDTVLVAGHGRGTAARHHRRRRCIGAGGAFGPDPFAGYRPIDFASTNELLEANVLDRPGCLILDVRMPSMSGLDLQQQLVGDGNPKPTIFLTGHGDIPMTVQAMKAGAVDFLTAPSATRRFGRGCRGHRPGQGAARRPRSFGATSNAGDAHATRARGPAGSRARSLNKQIAFDLGISEVTVKPIAATACARWSDVRRRSDPHLGNVASGTARSAK